MKYLLYFYLIIPIFVFPQGNTTQTQEDFSSLFVSNKNSFQYYDIQLYNELDNYLPINELQSVSNVIYITNYITNIINTVPSSSFRGVPKTITPVPIELYNTTNFNNIQTFFINIQSGDTYKVIEALNKGMHPDIRNVTDRINGSTPLLIASSYRRVLITKTLLFEGADPNLSTHRLGVSNITPLMIAAQQGPLEIVQDLVNGGANINSQTTGVIAGNTALMVAVNNQHSDIVEFLLSNRADVNLITINGTVNNINALMLASQTGNLQIVRQLVQTPNINLNAVDSEGKSALVYAYLSSNIELIGYLISVGVTTTFTPTEIQALLRNQSS